MVEEITEEEFEKLEVVGKPIKVFENAADKIDKYNYYDKKCNNRRYNIAYSRVLQARGDQSCLVDENGNVDEDSLGVVEEALIAFDMNAYGQMGDRFGDRVRKKLSNYDSKVLLKKFRALSILSPEIKGLESDTEDFYNILSAKEDNCLDARGYGFSVGATKIMNFLFPELFVIVDKWVKKGLRKTGPLNFRKYWSVMTLCQDQLNEWQTSHGDLKNLIKLDQQPTTLTRIFDKCAFVMGKFGL